MAVQTRTQLQTKSATVQNETAPSANTAARVGGLFDDFADSVTLNGERGFATLYLDSDTSFATDSGGAITLDSSMNPGPYSGSVFQVGDYTIAYKGLTPAAIRVSFLLSFSGINNRRYVFYIAKNGNVITQSSSNNTTQGTHDHPVFIEAFENVNKDDEFTVVVESNVTDNITIRTLTFSAFTI